MFGGVVGMLIVSVVFIFGLYLVHRALAILPSAHEVLPFQSGWQPSEHALSRYHVRWYAVTLLFLAFDVEMLFMYPWAVVVATEGAGAVLEMFLFLGALFVAVFWAWREGALRWV